MSASAQLSKPPRLEQQPSKRGDARERPEWGAYCRKRQATSDVRGDGKATGSLLMPPQESRPSAGQRTSAAPNLARQLKVLDEILSHFVAVNVIEFDVHQSAVILHDV